MRTHRKVIAPMIAAVIVMLVSASATAPRSALADQGVNRLPGSWRVQITTAAQGSFPGLLTFTSDGAVIATESPGPFESPGLGNWVRRGRDVDLTFLVLFGSPAGGGRNTGSAKIVSTLHFDPRSGGWEGVFRIQVFNTAGAVLFEDCGEFQLTRIEVEKFDCHECADRSLCS